MMLKLERRWSKGGGEVSRIGSLVLPSVTPFQSLLLHLAHADESMSRKLLHTFLQMALQGSSPSLHPFCIRVEAIEWQPLIARFQKGTPA